MSVVLKAFLGVTLQDTCNGTGGSNCTASTYFRVAGQQEVSQNPDYTSILTVRPPRPLHGQTLHACSCMCGRWCCCCVTRRGGLHAAVHVHSRDCSGGECREFI
jgi:hypothetical protein